MLNYLFFAYKDDVTGYFVVSDVSPSDQKQSIVGRFEMKILLFVLKNVAFNSLIVLSM